MTFDYSIGGLSSESPPEGGRWSVSSLNVEHLPAGVLRIIRQHHDCPIARFEADAELNRRAGG